MSQYLTVQVVAKRLAISEKSVRRLVKLGMIVACRFGRSIRIDERELTAYLAQAGASVLRRGEQLRADSGPKYRTRGFTHLERRGRNASGGG